jgi:hypothetical protein
LRWLAYEYAQHPGRSRGRVEDGDPLAGVAWADLQPAEPTAARPAALRNSRRSNGLLIHDLQGRWDSRV